MEFVNLRAGTQLMTDFRVGFLGKCETGSTPILYGWFSGEGHDQLGMSTIFAILTREIRRNGWGRVKEEKER